MKRATALWFASTVFALGARAEAQVDGGEAGLRLSVDRLFGVQYSTTTVTAGFAVASSRQLSVSAFGTYLGSVATTLVQGPRVPVRIGLDWEFANRFTLGAAFAFGWTNSGDGDASLTLFAFGIAPRVGYVVPVGRRVRFWPRIGVTFGYNVVSTDSPRSSATIEGKALELAANLEPTFVFLLSNGFGITAAVNLDITMVGNVAYGSASVGDVSFSRFALGLQTGVQGRF